MAFNPMDMNTPSVAPTPTKTIAQLQADIAAQQQKVKDLTATALAAQTKAEAATVKMDPTYGVTLAQQAKDAATPGSQAYIDANNALTQAKNVVALGPKPADKAGYTVTRVGNTWQYVSNGTGGGVGGGGYIPPTTPTTPATQPAAIKGVTQSAKDIVNQFLLESGMGELSNDVWSQWTAGTSAPQIIDYVRKTPQYAARFPAMAALNKAGRNISEAAYIAKEQADIDLMKQYDIPLSVYGTTAYLGSLIENNVTYNDLNSRLIAVRDTVKSYDPSILKYAQDTFGLSEGDLMGWALDPVKTLPAIQQKAEAFKIGGAALAAGYNAQSANKELTQEQANALAAAGITQQQAQQGFTNLGQMGQYQQALPGEATAPLTEQQLINAQFGLNAPDVEALKIAKQKKLSEFEQGGNFAATQAGIVGLGTSSNV